MSDMSVVALIVAIPPTMIGLVNAGVTLWTARKVVDVHTAVSCQHKEIIDVIKDAVKS